MIHLKSVKLIFNEFRSYFLIKISISTILDKCGDRDYFVATFVANFLFLLDIAALILWNENKFLVIFLSKIVIVLKLFGDVNRNINRNVNRKRKERQEWNRKWIHTSS